MSEITPIQQKIIQQIEYYFSDSNFPNDKFLKTEAAKNDDGWVALSVILTFKRIQALVAQHEGAPAKVAAIAEAVKLSTADKVTINDANDHVRRTTPVPESTKFDSRTIYAKGFPAPLQPYQIKELADNAKAAGEPVPEKKEIVLPTIDELSDFFGAHGEVNSIKMRRVLKNKQFKGSLFVEFASDEDAKKVSELKLKFNDSDENDLVLMMKSDYFAMKSEQRKSKRNAKKEVEKVAKKAKQDEEKEKKIKAEEELAAEHQATVDKMTIDVTKGAVLHFSGVAEGTQREDLKDVFIEFGEIGWIEFEKGESEGDIRFKEENGAVVAKEKYEAAKTEVEGAVLTVTVLEGEAEQKYWDEALTQKKTQVLEKLQRQAQNKNRGKGAFGRGRGRGGRGGRGGGRGGRGGYKRGRDGDSGPNKRARTD